MYPFSEGTSNKLNLSPGGTLTSFFSNHIHNCKKPFPHTRGVRVAVFKNQDAESALWAGNGSSIWLFFFFFKSLIEKGSTGISLNRIKVTIKTFQSSLMHPGVSSVFLANHV